MRTMNEDFARSDELGGAPLDKADMATKVEAGKTPVPSRGRKRWLIPALAAVAVIGTATAITFGFLYLRDDVAPEEVGGYLATQTPLVEERAEQVADLLVNYDSTTLEEVSDRMLEISTGNFREQYQAALGTGPGLSAALEEASASSRGSILEGPDVSFVSPSEAVAIMRLTQTAQSNSNPGGQSFVYVLKITLIDTTDGGWKADLVEVLSTQQD